MFHNTPQIYDWNKHALLRFNDFAAYIIGVIEFNNKKTAVDFKFNDLALKSNHFNSS